MATSTRTSAAEQARTTIQRRIDADVEERSDAFLLYDTYQVERLARQAFRSFGAKSDGTPNRSQMRKLERVALSAGTYSEVVNYVKSQAGRKTRGEWRREGFAYDLHDQLEAVREEAEGRAATVIDGIERSLVADIQGEDERKKDAEKRIQNWVTHEMRLRFVQRYVGHLAAEYMFVISKEVA